MFLMRMSRLLFLFSLFVSSHLLAAELVGDAARGQAKSTTCVACHGGDGNSISSAFPKIAGQYEGYLVEQLLDYQSQKRKNAVMYGIVQALSAQDIADLAAYYAGQKTSRNAANKSADLALAEAIYRGGKLSDKGAACIACHGPAGKGIESAAFPLLSFQYAEYTAQQLRNFRQYYLDQQLNQESPNTRANDENAMMRDVTKNLTDLEIEALAEYIAGLH